MLVFLVLSATTFSLLGFVLGIGATSWEKLQFMPALIITPLTFLGGTFYSINMLPPVWQIVTLSNPIVYVVSGFRWCFFGQSSVDVRSSFMLIAGMLLGCLAVAVRMIRSGWRLRH
jgi:ABC-2 type transport system permease protein